MLIKAKGSVVLDSAAQTGGTPDPWTGSFLLTGQFLGFLHVVSKQLVNTPPARLHTSQPLVGGVLFLLHISAPSCAVVYNSTQHA